jgi:hypothetical protein
VRFADRTAILLESRPPPPPEQKRSTGAEAACRLERVADVVVVADEEEGGASSAARLGFPPMDPYGSPLPGCWILELRVLRRLPEGSSLFLSLSLFLITAAKRV